MADFEAITSQEALDAVIKDRINRLNEKHAKEISEKYGDYDDLKTKVTDFETKISELSSALDEANIKISGHSKELAERDTKIKAFEIESLKGRIADDLGLSHSAIGFLKGEDETTIRESAESLKSLMGSKTAPSANAEPVLDANSDRAAYRSMLANLV